VIPKSQNNFSVWLSLFASVSTLLCCALPALLVTLGFGAVVAGAISHIPGLIWLSEHKPLVFSLAAIILIVSGILRIKSAGMPCPLDAAKKELCLKLRKINGWVYAVSVFLYAVGFYFAFLVR